MPRKTVLEIVFLVLFFVFALLIRIWNIGNIPSVINGDESGSIVHPYQIIIGKLSLFQLTHDYSVPALVYYPKAFLTILLGVDNGLIAARLTTVIYSLLALGVFYLMVRKEFEFIPSLFSTILFASSYWFLNFSRLSWIAVDSVFFGLLFYYFLILSFEKDKWLFFVLAGVAASLVFMNYMGGRIYLLAGFILELKYFLQKNGKQKYKPLIIVGMFLLTLLAFIKVIFSDFDKYILRAKSISVFNLNSSYYGLEPKNIKGILFHQFKYSADGFFFFKKNVSSEGIENHRLLPLGKPAVNYFTVFLFYSGLTFSVIKKKGLFFWLIYLSNIVFLQIPSVFIPSWSRAVGILPVIYYFSALGMQEILIICKKIFKNINYPVVLCLATVVLIFAINDLKVYWKWVVSDEFLSSQEPAVKISELKDWQKCQYQEIKEGRSVIITYDWQNNELKKNLDCFK